MAGPRPWTVLPHGPLETLEENLKVVEGETPTPMNRRMSVVRLADGRLVFHNAVPLAEEAMAALERWGTPAFLLVPNGYHRLDIHAFAARYPGLKLLCPPESRTRVEQVARVDGDFTLLPQDPGLAWERLDGGKVGEAVFLSTCAGRTSAIFGDALMNLAHVHGLRGLLLRLLGSSGGPRVTLIARTFFFPGTAALRAHLERLAARPGLCRLVPSHGRLVLEDAARVLREVAARL